MDKTLLNEIIECLPKGKTMFYYYKDRYASMLLADYVGSGMPVREVKQSPFAGLLHRQPVKQAVASAGDGVLTADMLNSAWDENYLSFLLTLSEWGGEWEANQVSRSGYNLVLQLNFTASHEREYERLGAEDYLLFGTDLHPVMLKGQRELFRYTLAWARIDLDFSTGEALIEEVQSDWVRNVNRTVEHAKEKLADCGQWLGDECDRCVYNRLLGYNTRAVAPYAAVWQEAMLAAAIDFIRHELGIGVIYYHSYDTGCRVKDIAWERPPRSLYSTLPRRFCFQQTREAPGFLYGDPDFDRAYRGVPDPQWFVLAG